MQRWGIFVFRSGKWEVGDYVNHWPSFASCNTLKCVGNPKKANGNVHGVCFLWFRQVYLLHVFCLHLIHPSPFETTNLSRRLGSFLATGVLFLTSLALLWPFCPFFWLSCHCCFQSCLLRSTPTHRCFMNEQYGFHFFAHDYLVVRLAVHAVLVSFAVKTPMHVHCLWLT